MGNNDQFKRVRVGKYLNHKRENTITGPSLVLTNRKEAIFFYFFLIIRRNFFLARFNTACTRAPPLILETGKA